MTNRQPPDREDRTTEPSMEMLIARALDHAKADLSSGAKEEEDERRELINVLAAAEVYLERYNATGSFYLAHRALREFRELFAAMPDMDALHALEVQALRQRARDDTDNPPRRSRNGTPARRRRPRNSNGRAVATVEANGDLRVRASR